MKVIKNYIKTNNRIEMSDLTAIANLSILLVEPSEVQQKLIKK